MSQTREVIIVPDTDEKTEYKFEKIDKKSISKVILKECGNEGNEDTSEQKDIRELLQSLITYFGEHENMPQWKNAEVSVYGSTKTIVLVCGTGEHPFKVQRNGKHEAVVIDINHRTCSIC